MVNVAIAGGTGNVGLTILEVLKLQCTHRPFVLTRNPEKNDTGVPSIKVDYSGVDSLTQALKEHSIHTVISCLNYEGDALPVGQKNLIKAATASSVTERFVPSAFGIDYPTEAVKQLPVLSAYFEAITELRQSGLQWTLFENGCFLDYWGHPHIKSYLRPTPFGIDIAHRQASIPGNGDDQFTVTYSYDVAKFVVASLDLKEWPEVSRIAGDIITWHEFVRIAEEVTGEKFQVAYDSIERLENGQLTELPSQIPCYANVPKPQFQWFISIFAKWTTVKEIGYIPGELNEKFPHIKPLTVRDMLEKYWKTTGSDK
ncbi:hypothetical protein ACHAPJ_011893 [Fusarium lateritium]